MSVTVRGVTKEGEGTILSFPTGKEGSALSWVYSFVVLWCFFLWHASLWFIIQKHVFEKGLLRLVFVNGKNIHRLKSYLF